MRNQYKAQIRYERRRAKRLAKKVSKYSSCDNIEKVFTYSNLNMSCCKCCHGVRWKSSVQSYLANRPMNISNVRSKLLSGKFRSKGFYEFDIMERGKKRHIQSVTFSERVVQRCLCDYSLTPVLSRKFIYDNGASMRGKGYSFSIDRLTEHLHRYYRKYGQIGYILIMDFSKYFDNIRHDYIKSIVRKEYSDKRLVKLIEYLVDSFPGELGLGLGSQVSQILALFNANALDHYVKEQLGIRYYGRYMDDSYMIHPSKKYLQECLKKIREKCLECGIVLNQDKVRICKLSSVFTFLKVRFSLTRTGRVVRRVHKKNIVRMRRRLKSFRRLVDEGYLTLDDVNHSYQSWLGHVSHLNAYRTVQNMNRLYRSLF